MTGHFRRLVRHHVVMAATLPLIAVTACGLNEPKEVTAAQEAVKARLNDPASAQFAKVELHSLNGEPAAVCGEVNAKNRMGGYGGFERFIYIVKSGDVDIDTKTTPGGSGLIIAPDLAERQISFNKLYIEHCIPTGL